MFYNSRTFSKLSFTLRRQQTSHRQSLLAINLCTKHFAADNEKPKMTMEDVKCKMNERLGLDPGFQLKPKSRDHLLKYTPKLEELPPRTMKDSFTSVLLPLSTEPALQNSYVSYLGRVRMGRLLEDMDLFAVWVCHQHVELPKLPAGVHLPYTFVTVLVDKINFVDLVTDIKQDVRLTGHVSWVGRSSLEIMVWLDQVRDGVYANITRALFLMAARNANNTGAAPVNPLLAQTEQECKIMAEGVERMKRRKADAKKSIFSSEPEYDETSLMYKLYQKTVAKDTMQLNKRVLPENSRWMANWGNTTTLMSFPENRNAHNYVFGGFIMRQALETSWNTAMLYMKARPRLICICDISFKKPVPIPSLIKMYSYVIYTEGKCILIMTAADIITMSKQHEITTNVFYSTYMSENIVPEILPESYHETMWYIQGRRKYRYALENAKVEASKASTKPHI